VDGGSDFFPCADLGGAPDTWDVARGAGLGSDECSFGNEEVSWDGAPLLVVFFDEGEWDVVCVCSEAGHGGYGDSVLESHLTKLEGGLNSLDVFED
jgi:hypothetical protein